MERVEIEILILLEVSRIILSLRVYKCVWNSTDISCYFFFTTTDNEYIFTVISEQQIFFERVTRTFFDV